MNNTLIKCFLLPVCFLISMRAGAHSLPNTTAQIYVQDNRLLITFKTPVEIFELASGIRVDLQSKAAADSIKKYYLQHIAAYDPAKSRWNITLGESLVQETANAAIGKYPEIVTDILLTPGKKESLYNFYLNCDLVVHQVVNQSILFSVQQDLGNGVIAGNAQEAGVIGVDPATGKILPLNIQLKKTNWFNGCKNMLVLGMQHIKEGTDHLLFLIVLLLPAMLLVKGRQWGGFGGIQYSLSHLFKIVTAFTVGHSVTLLIGALGWLKLPAQPVEFLIAFSILVSAIHAMRPIFPGKEVYVAAGFGLVHGLAFAAVLSNLKLTASTLVLSILGFNAGIELMQLLIIVLIIPWLIILSKTFLYKWIRIVFACMAAIAALAWVAERIAGKANLVTELMAKLSQYGLWGILMIAMITVFSYTLTGYYNRRSLKTINGKG